MRIDGTGRPGWATRGGLAIALGLLALATGPAARAAAFHLGTQDGRATAMGMAVVADVADASAVFYNPAGLAQGRLLELRVGDTLIAPQFTETIGGVETSTKGKVSPPFHAYFAYGFAQDATVGVGFFSPFGLEANWPEGWPGRFVSTRSALRTYFINPEVAYRFLGRLRVGAGVQIVRGAVDLRRVVAVAGQEVELDLSGTTWGVGANAGLQVDVLDSSWGFGQLSLGAAWRSPVSLDFKEGVAHFSGVPPPLAPLLRDQGVATSVTLPQVLALGVAWRYGGLRLGVDTEYTGWQSLSAIDLAFDDPAQNASVAKLFAHTWNLHVGGEYAITESWLVRLGFLYDPTPSPPETLAPDLPDGDRINVAAGVGFRLSGFSADLAYQYVQLMEQDSTFPLLPGTLSGNAHVVGLTLGYVLRL